MDRKYLEYLNKWAIDPKRKPLIIWGARQIGKSYLIEELFAKVYYKNRYLRIDCSDNSDFVEYVYKNNNLDKTLNYLRINYGFVADKNHLLIFDEVQECLPIIKMLKHFCENKREIPVIVTGSMVRMKIIREAHKRGGFAINNRFLFPVGKINELYMHQLTFDEFLYNYNFELYKHVKESFNLNVALEPTYHKLVSDVFNDYLFLGGMPEVLDTYLENKEDRVDALLKCYEKITEIYNNYLADMDLYQASPEAIIRSRLIYNSIYKQLNKENKNFKYSLIKNDVKSRDLLSSINWLIEAKVIFQSFLLKEKITTPLIKENDSLMRLYLSDMGMFTFQSGLNAKTFITNKENALSGLFFENYAAIELSARQIELFYWKGKRDSELEFVIDDCGSIIPIDVKKGKNKIASLKEFRFHNKKDIAIKVSSNQYGYDSQNKILTIPFYYLPFYLDKLQDNKKKLLVKAN